MTVRHITTGVDESSVGGFNEPTPYTGTSGLEPTGVTASGSLAVGQYSPNETLGANVEAPQRRRPPLAENGKAASGGLDKSLLERAKTIIDCFNPDDVMDVTINLESLRGIILNLWESATNSTKFHQEILAILESAMLSVESPHEDHLSVFREAILDIGSDVLTQANAEVIRRRFINTGFSPLALLSEIEDDDGNGGQRAEDVQGRKDS